MELIKRSIPFVAVGTTDFETLTRAICQAKGYNFDELSWLILPGDINILPEEDIYQIVVERIEEIKDHLIGKTGVLTGR